MKLQVCDIVEYGLNSFGTAPETWRVTHHLKRMEDDLDSWIPDNIGGEIVKKVLLEGRQEEKEERLKLGLPANRRFYLKHCKPEEATHVFLVGIRGDYALIDECKFVKVVEWDSKLIKERRKDAISDFWLKQDYRNWLWE